MTTAKSKHTRTIFPLLLALFIDGMGLAILFPILNDIIMVPDLSILPLDSSEQARFFAYSATIGSFFLCWFFGTAFISDLSDDIGRKKSLILCLVCSGIGYSFAALAIIYKSLFLLILGRVIAGFTIGSQPIAQAAIIDISTPKTKSRNISLTLLGPSIGFIVGPLIGGFFSNSDYLPWFSPAVPMIFAAVLSYLNAVMLTIYFDETRKIHGKVKLSLKRAFRVFQDAFAENHIRNLSFILLFLILGWSSFFSFIAIFLLKYQHLDAGGTGLYMAATGIGFGIGSAFLTRWVIHWFELKKGMMITALLTSGAIALTCITKPLFLVMILGAFIGAFGMVAYSILLNIFSNQADSNSQGWIMGITSSVTAFAFTVTALGEAAISHMNAVYPLYIAVFCMVVSSIMMLFYHRVPTATVHHYENETTNLEL